MPVYVCDTNERDYDGAFFRLMTTTIFIYYILGQKCRVKKNRSFLVGVQDDIWSGIIEMGFLICWKVRGYCYYLKGKMWGWAQFLQEVWLIRNEIERKRKTQITGRSNSYVSSSWVTQSKTNFNRLTCKNKCISRMGSHKRITKGDICWLHWNRYFP